MNYAKRYVSSHFWDDNYIVKLEPVEKLLFLYFLTNPSVRISAVYEISLRRIAFDTGIKQDMIEKILNKFEKAGKVYYDKGHIIIPNFPKHQSYNIKMAIGVCNDLAQVKNILKDSKGFKMLLKNTISIAKTSKAFQSLDKPFKALDIYEYELEYEEEKEEEEELEYEEEEKKENTKEKATAKPSLCSQVIQSFNEHVEKYLGHKGKYKTTEANCKLIRARAKEGFVLEDFIQVLDTMFEIWSRRPEMRQYLRPTTLFRASKFEGYLNRVVSPSEMGLVSKTTERNMAKLTKEEIQDIFGGNNED